MFWPFAAHAQSLMPVAATEIAKRVDELYVFLLIACFIACVLVIGGFIYFAFKYKRTSDNDKTAYITHNNTLEFAWSFIPFVIFMVSFAWGWWIYKDMRKAPENALEIHVVGQKWNWEFLYKSGKKTVGEFVVPVDEPIKLIITSRDVLHSVFFPAFRMKQDAIPGRYTSLWFQSQKEGSFNLFCTEYCGDEHSAMLAKVKVVPRSEYDAWLRDDPFKGLSLAQIGKKVYEGRCVACHNTDAVSKVGPGFGGLFGSERQFADGTSAKADEEYLRESIVEPNKKIVANYPAGVMPTFAGQLDEQELAGLVEFIKEL